MKRFGRLVLDPANVMAVAPLAPSGLAQHPRYAVWFFNGSMLTAELADAVLLMDHLAPVSHPPTQP